MAAYSSSILSLASKSCFLAVFNIVFKQKHSKSNQKASYLLPSEPGSGYISSLELGSKFILPLEHGSGYLLKVEINPDSSQGLESNPNSNDQEKYITIYLILYSIINIYNDFS